MQEFDEISIFKHLNFQKSQLKKINFQKYQLGIKKSQFQKMPFSKISIFKKNCNFQKSQFKKKGTFQKIFFSNTPFFKNLFHTFSVPLNHQNLFGFTALYHVVKLLGN